MSQTKHDSLTLEEKESRHQNNGQKKKAIDKEGLREATGKSSNKQEALGEFTDEEEDWKSTEKDHAETNTDQHEETQDKTDIKHKSNLRFVTFCILVILTAFPLFGLIIYLVQEGRKVKC